MFESLIMQVNGEAAANSIWGLFLAISAIFGTVSLIAIKIATKVKDRLKNSNNVNHQKLVAVIDDYVLPLLETGNDFVDKTKEQEAKIKEGMEIIYNFMGPKADEITAKPLVKIDKLTTDVNKANVQAEEYRVKLERLMAIMDELKGQAPTEPVAPKSLRSSPIPTTTAKY